MTTQISIRQATRLDVAQMVLLLQQLFNIERDFIPNPEAQHRGLELLLESPRARLFLAEQAGRIVGMLTVQIVISTAEGGLVGWVEDVVVHEAHRGQGVGEALLDHLQQWSVRKGLSRLQLLADRSNVRALDFYQRNGWALTDLLGLRQRVCAIS